MLLYFMQLSHNMNTRMVNHQHFPHLAHSQSFQLGVIERKGVVGIRWGYFEQMV